MSVTNKQIDKLLGQACVMTTTHDETGPVLLIARERSYVIYREDGHEGKLHRDYIKSLTRRPSCLPQS